MAEIRVEIQGLDRIKRLVSDPQVIAGPIHEFLSKSAFSVERRAKEFAPTGVNSFLRTRIRSFIRPLEAEVAALAPYAAHVEFGTRPHMPPPEALISWVRKKWRPQALAVSVRTGRATRSLKGATADAAIRQAAWRLAMHIAKHGTRPHPFMGPAAEQSRGDIERFLDEAARALERRWAA